MPNTVNGLSGKEANSTDQLSGGNLAQKFATKAIENKLEQQEQQGQNAVSLIQSSGIGQGLGQNINLRV